MDAISLIIGVGIICFLLIYISFKLDTEHYVLKLFLIFIFIFLITLIPKATIDYNDNCDFVIKNITTSAPIDHYEYDYICSDNPNTTSLTFLRTVFLVQRFFVAYFITYLFYAVYIKWKVWQK